MDPARFPLVKRTYVRSINRHSQLRVSSELHFNYINSACIPDFLHPGLFASRTFCIPDFLLSGLFVFRTLICQLSITNPEGVRVGSAKTK
jgi:hypothetical protein